MLYNISLKLIFKFYYFKNCLLLKSNFYLILMIFFGVDHL